jgi:hypothetical protein
MIILVFALDLTDANPAVFAVRQVGSWSAIVTNLPFDDICYCIHMRYCNILTHNIFAGINFGYICYRHDHVQVMTC